MRDSENGGGSYRGDVGEHCHCQGGRLLVLFGPVGYKLGRSGRPVTVGGQHVPADTAMFNAQNWALGFYEAQRNAGKHIHLLSYGAPSQGAPNDVHHPSIPVHGATAAETVTTEPSGEALALPGWGWKWDNTKRVDKLEDTLPKCCCFLTEVLLICHGGQGADVSFITETLAKVIGGRPVEKFVLWACRSGRLAMPGEPSYREICAAFRPRMCDCGCTAGACMAFDPDGRQRHCPDGTQATTIITSGQFEGKLTPVGLAPSKSPPLANPFTTPDGDVRTITIAPDTQPPTNDQATASVSPPGSPGAAVPIFGGAGVTKLPPKPPPPADPAAAKKLKDRLEAPSTVGRKRTPYTGPKLNLSVCDPTDGCIPGASQTSPP